jgi:hypothetical protein
MYPQSDDLAAPCQITHVCLRAGWLQRRLPECYFATPVSSTLHDASGRSPYNQEDLQAADTYNPAGKILTVTMRANAPPNISALFRPKNKQRYRESGTLA